MRYHEHKQMWADFEEDEKEFRQNRSKYKGISPRPENFGWYYRHNNKTVKSGRRLADMYEFKLKFESQLDSKDTQRSSHSKRGFD